MKKQIILILMMLLPMVTGAETVEIDGINYELVSNTKEATVIKKNSGKYTGNVVIPASVTYDGVEYSVTGTGYAAFYECSSMTSITIPNSVTVIGIMTFIGCTGLTSVHISDIAAWCKITIPNYYDNPLNYAHHLYLGEEEIKDLVIPNSVTSIGNYTFQYCSGLTSVSIPNSVKNIGNSAFLGCSGLTSVTIGNGVTSIGGNAFGGCSSLTSITIPNSITSIGGSAFINCTSLTSIIIPNSVTSIGGSAFSGCYFHYSSFINNSTLMNSNNWGATLVDKETEDGLLIKDNTIVKCRPWAISVTIPNSVTSIGGSAFYECYYLTSVTIGNSVTNIGYEAFYNCSGLTSVTIPNSVTSIGGSAFEHCI